MRDEKPLEQTILDRFFEELNKRTDFPPSIVERLLELRQKGSRRSATNMLEVLKGKAKSNA